MYKPLVISRSYLCDKSSVGQIQRVFWEFLKEHDFDPTIICSKSKLNDIPLDRFNYRVEPTYDSQILHDLVAVLKRIIALDIANVPDYAQYTWARSATKKAKLEVKSGHYDHIFSVCVPFTGHLIALETKRASGLPWIASFYDPWVDNPYRPFKFRYFYERDKRNEALVAENADAIIHSNMAIYNEWVERYGEGIKEKMYVIPFVFRPVQECSDASICKKDNSKFVISHIGTLYPGRDSVDFLKALHLMLHEHPELKKRILLRYVGKVTDNDKDSVRKYDLSDITEFLGFLGERDCLRYFEESDMFLAIDGKNARNIFFPSKILKYFYYGKPILGLTPLGSALQYELQQSHNAYFENEDYHGISDFLYQAVSSDNFSINNDTEYWKNFTMEKIYPQYMDIVSHVIRHEESKHN